MRVGEQCTLNFTLRFPDQGIAPQAFFRVSYTSSNTAVATVSAAGSITGLTAGTTTISIIVTGENGRPVVTSTLPVNVSP